MLPVLRGFFLLIVVLFFSLSVPRAWSQQAAPVPSPDDNAEAYVKHGIENGEKGNFDAAIAAFDEAIKIDPNSAPAYENRGYARSIQNQFDAAIADYDKAIQLEPKYQIAYYHRGVAKAEKGDFDAAIADFTSTIDLNPKHAPAYYNRGHVKYFKGDLAGAMMDLNQAITLDPNFPYIYFIRGLVRHVQNDREGATADFQKSISPGLVYGVFWLWIIQMENGDRNAAHGTLSDYLTKPELVKSDDWPAPIADFLLGKIPQDQLLAKALVQKNAALKDCLCEAWFYAGMAKHFSGDDKGALDCFHQAIATAAKDSEERIEAQREAATLAPPP